MRTSTWVVDPYEGRKGPTANSALSVRRRWCRVVLVALLISAVGVVGQITESVAQTVNFYHGTDCDTAKRIAQNPIDYYSGSYDGPLIAGGQGAWTPYTDFGKGFYTHMPENKALTVKWANRTSKNNRKAQWGIVIFAVPQNLLVQVPISRILHYGTKRDRPYNSPYQLNWLEFIEVNRHLRPPPQPAVQKPDDYYYGEYYDWIQGPIWAPRDSGIQQGGKPLPDHIHQRNWMGYGLGILNASWRQVECGNVYNDDDDATPHQAGYSIFVLTNASNGLYLGTDDSLRDRTRCSFVGGGVNCQPTDRVTAQRLLGPFAARAAAEQALCQSITERRVFPLGVGLKGKWQNSNTWYGLWDGSVTTSCGR